MNEKCDHIVGWATYYPAAPYGDESNSTMLTVSDCEDHNAHEESENNVLEGWFSYCPVCGMDISEIVSKLK